VGRYKPLCSYSMSVDVLLNDDMWSVHFGVSRRMTNIGFMLQLVTVCRFQFFNCVESQKFTLNQRKRRYSESSNQFGSNCLEHRLKSVFALLSSLSTAIDLTYGYC
jgi:hypothetical protein